MIKRNCFSVVASVAGLVVAAGLSVSAPPEVHAMSDVATRGLLLKGGNEKPGLVDGGWLPSGSWFEGKGWPTESGMQAGLAGMLPGGCEVSSSGNLRCSIPLEVPAGRVGMAAGLSLEYGGGGSGPLGIGWSVSGAMSAITLCGESFAVDGFVGGVNYRYPISPLDEAPSDRFCLDGQKLVEVKGGYGQEEYRTAAESFVQVRAYGSAPGVAPERFEVRSKGGTISTYVAITGTRYEATEKGLKVLGEPRVIWMLDTVRDRSENFVKYEYVIDRETRNLPGSEVLSPVVSLEVLPKRILFTGNRQMNAPAGIHLPQREIEFIYREQPRMDSQERWLNGVLSRQTKLLSAIQMKAPNPNNVNAKVGSPEAVWTYQFTYKTSQHSGRTLLASVERCALGGQMKGGGCFEKKVLDWYDAAPVPTFTAQPLKTLRAGMVGGEAVSGPAALSYDLDFPDDNPPGSYSADGHADLIPVLQVGDVDNNGMADVITQLYGTMQWHWPKELIEKSDAPPGPPPPPESVGWQLLQRGQRLMNNKVFPLQSETLVSVSGLGTGTAPLLASSMLDLDQDGQSEWWVLRVFRDTVTQKWMCEQVQTRWDNASQLFTKVNSMPAYECSMSDTPFSHLFMDVNGDQWPELLTTRPRWVTSPNDPLKMKWLPDTWQANRLTHAAGSNVMSPVAQGDTKVVAGCAIRLVDVDGDGKTELLTKPWREDLAQWKFGCDPTKTLVLSQQEGLVQVGPPTYKVEEDTQGKYPRLSEGMSTDWESGKTDLKVTTQFLDVNGDGLADAWDVSNSPQLKVRLNTGNGFLPSMPITGFPNWSMQDESLCDTFGLPSGCVFDKIGGNEDGRVEEGAGFQAVGDVNGDGRSDVMVLERLPVDPVTKAHRGKAHLMLSQGNGTFTKVTLTDTPALSEMAGMWFPKSGFVFTAGDFNGDGRIDFVSGADRSTCDAQPNGAPCKVNRKYELQLYTQSSTGGADNPSGVTDVMKGWRDGNRWLSFEVKYDTRWADKWSGGEGPCGEDKTCLRRGGWGVGELLPRWEGVVVAEGVTSRPKVFKLSYEGPIGSVQRGFLGFKKVRMYEPLRPMETVKEYDFDMAVDIGRHGRYEPVFPYADSPKRVTTTVPLLKGDEVTWWETGAWPSKRQVRAQVTRSETLTTEVRQLPQANGAKTWLLLPRESRSQVWEQSVLIDQTLTSPDNLTLDRIRGVQVTPALVMNQVDNVLDYDNWGNTTFSQSSVKNGQTTTMENTFYPADEANWLLGLVESTRVSTKQANPQVPMTLNYTSFTYTSKGQLKTVEREPQASDPYTRLTVENSYDDWGNVISQAAYGTNSEGKPETRRSNVEYDALLPGQPEERLYPSQTWLSDHSALSSWTAIHPAFGVPIATQDALGNYVQYKYDVGGRLIETQGEIGGRGTLRYAARPDCKDSAGVSHCSNGLIVTSQQFDAQGALQATGKSVKDGLGRTLTQQGTTFDGGIAEVQVKYDSLGRTIKTSRPYAPGQAPVFNLTDYDTLDRVVRQQDPSQVGTSVATTYTYITSSNPMETLTTVVKDAEGNHRSSVTNVDGRVVQSTEYLKQANQPDKLLTTRYQYGSRGLERTIDPKGNQDYAEYNALGQLTYYKSVGTGSVEIGKDSFGADRYVKHLETNEQVNFVYDTLGRLTKRSVADLKGNALFQAEFTWDSATNGLGQLASTRAINGLAPATDIVETSYGYDSHGRSLTSTLTLDGQSYTHQVGYDPDGRLQSLQFPGPNGQSSLQACYGYNPRGALLTVTRVDPGAACTSNGQPLWKVNFRNLEGALVQGELGNNVTVGRGYDPLTGRLLNMTANTLSNAVPPPPPLMDLRYGHYKNGLVKTRQDYAYRDANGVLQPRLEEFKYEDGLLRLTESNLTFKGQVNKTQYTYDDLGNRLTTAFSQYALGQAPAPFKEIERRQYQEPTQPHALTRFEDLVSGEVIDYQRDPQGREMQSSTPAANGQAVIKRRLNYQVGGLLPRTVTTGEGPEMLTYTLTYDAFGTRVKKTGKYGTIHYAGGVEKRISDGQETWEISIPGSEGVLTQVVKHVKPTSNQETRYVLQDALGSSGIVLDGTGNVIERRFHEPFGKQVKDDGTPVPTTPNAYVGQLTRGFTGQELEPELGLVNMNGRLLDSKNRTFLQADPLLGVGQRANRYSYVTNLPTVLNDPSGFDGECPANTTCDPYGGGGSLHGAEPPPGSGQPASDETCKSCGGLLLPPPPPIGTGTNAVGGAPQGAGGGSTYEVWVTQENPEAWTSEVPAADTGAAAAMSVQLEIPDKNADLLEMQRLYDTEYYDLVARGAELTWNRQQDPYHYPTGENAAIDERCRANSPTGTGCIISADHPWINLIYGALVAANQAKKEELGGGTHGLGKAMFGGRSSGPTIIKLSNPAPSRLKVQGIAVSGHGHKRVIVDMLPDKMEKLEFSWQGETGRELFAQRAAISLPFNIKDALVVFIHGHPNGLSPGQTLDLIKGIKQGFAQGAAQGNIVPSKIVLASCSLGCSPIPPLIAGRFGKPTVAFDADPDLWINLNGFRVRLIFPAGAKAMEFAPNGGKTTEMDVSTTPYGSP